MLRRGTNNRSWPNSLIERYESALVPHCERQQISMRDLLRSEQLCVIE
jgi:hypothetical protein